MNILQLWREWRQKSQRNSEITKMRGSVRVILILLLLISIFVGAIPGYLSGGRWQWSQLPKSDLTTVKSVLDGGLQLPDWTIVEHQTARIGGKKWSIQVMNSADELPVMLMLLPQNYYLDKPGVEWMDLNGLERWKTDSFRQLDFSAESNSIIVKARIFRAWNPQQTFAVVQWYAHPFGGGHSNWSWFWRDQIAQLHHRRVPWIAVSCKIPIEPLEDLDRVQPQAELLARQIQQQLFPSGTT
jgi:cyanoexosortase B-associated protein